MPDSDYEALVRAQVGRLREAGPLGPLSWRGMALHPVGECASCDAVRVLENEPEAERMDA